ncbi:MAG: methyltransferase [Bacteroidales bacterium]|nr:methyltransferase [Bacteroidales bacterium]
MQEKLFHFKQFSISQNNSALKICTDSVLLGAYTDKNDCATVLDIGTGTGVLALMIAQKTNAKITAIDIDNGAIIDAQKNFNNSPWKDRLELFEMSIQDFNLYNSYYDLIVCNPPYFQNSLLSPKASKSIAKHNISLSIEELFGAVSRLLSPHGQFNMIIPFDLESTVISTSRLFNLHLEKQVFIKPTNNKPANRIIFQFSLLKKNFYSVETIVIEPQIRHQYSERYNQLLKEYLLKL